MSNPLDTKVISKLAEILDKSNLTELEYEDEGCRICLTRELPPILQKNNKNITFLLFLHKKRAKMTIFM